MRKQYFNRDRVVWKRFLFFMVLGYVPTVGPAQLSDPEKIMATWNWQ